MRHPRPRILSPSRVAGIASLVVVVALLGGVGVLATLALGVVALPLALIARRWRPSTLAGAPVLDAIALGALVLLPIAVGLAWAAWTAAPRPAAAPAAVLTDGRRVVTYLAMVHVAEPAAYDAAAAAVRRARAAGAAIAVEGIGGGTPDGRARLAALTGDADTGGALAALAAALGLAAQADWPDLTCPDPAAPVAGTACVDLTADEASACYERLAGPLIAVAPPRATAWTGFRWIAFALTLPPRPLIPVLPTLTRAALPAPGLPAGSAPARPRPATPDDPIAVINACREQRLAEWVQRAPAERIVVVYGAGHVHGLVAALRERDPAWRIEIGSPAPP